LTPTIYRFDLYIAWRMWEIGFTQREIGELIKVPQSVIGHRFRKSGHFSVKKGRFLKANIGDKNGQWKGAKVKRHSLHAWINYNFIKPESCEFCGTKSASLFDWSNKDHKYTRDREDWQYLCRSCHMKYDFKFLERKVRGGKKKQIST